MKTNLFIVLSLCAQVLFAQNHPQIGGMNVYYGHLHNHTGFSDGEENPSAAYAHARDVAGLDFMGISEHGIQLSSGEWNDLKSIANQFNVSGNFVTFWGFEWSSSLLYGHVSVMNTDDFTDVLSDFTFSSLVSWLNDRDGIAFFNHAGREDYGLEFEHFEFPPSDKFVGIELWNKGSGFEDYYYNDGYFDNDGDKGYFEEAIDRGWKIGASGAHDHHGTDWGEVDMAIGVLAPDLTRDELYAALKGKSFFSTEDRSIALSFQLSGNEMGSTLAPLNDQTLTIQSFDVQNERFVRAELYRNGILFYTWHLNTQNVSLSHTVTTANNDYYYVKLTQADGDEVISSPVFIEGNTNNIPPSVVIDGPDDGSVFTESVAINVIASAYDLDGNVSRVDFYNGTQLVGSDSSSPYSFIWANVEEGTYQIVAKAVDNDGAARASEAVAVTVEPLQTITISSRIIDEDDDAEEGWTGVVYRSSTDLELVNDGFLAGDQEVGLRFKNLNLPKGAIINSAYIQFTCDETSSGSTSVTIRGEASSTSLGFDDQNVSSRPVTQNQVNWNIVAWNTAGEAGINQRTPDLMNIVQELANRSDWSVNSTMTFMITGDGKRTAEAYDGDASKAPLLVIEYSTPVGVRMTAPSHDGVAEIKEVVEAHGHSSDEINEGLIYPNPFKDELIIQINNDEIVALRVYNLKGQLVTIENDIKSVSYTLNTREYEKGMYIISITGTKQVVTKKMYKE